ncbi:MAG: primosomal protein N' [Candidatus Omnitrophica bacterium]|nr:primosomal protein N' [Candidatus Omnitrophota bacterium]
MTLKYVEIATGLPIDRTFQYAVTGNEAYPAEIGKRAIIEFGHRRMVGYIVRLEDEPVCKDPKPVIDILDETPVITRDLVQVAEWMKDHYFSSWGECLEAMLPGVMKRGKMSSTSRIEEKQRPVEATTNLRPNQEQQSVLDEVAQCIDSNKHKVFLLHGITGSGKTEIYLQAMERVLAKGLSGVVLVPEISLTPQTVERFVSRFGDNVAVFHSKMLESARFSEWKRIKEDRAKIVVGPRSAVFSPFRKPGIFVIDEEHEPSYKQEDSPRYHAREVAIKRAELAGVPVILGSATPSLESYHKAVKGEYRLVELTQRIDEKKLPKVRLVDMRMDFDTRTGKVSVSPALGEALKRDIKKKQQALLFINRRGFSTFINCRKCGHVMKCVKCDSPFVFHKEEQALVCHYCNKRAEPPKMCPACGDDYVVYKGTGTEKVETEIKRLLPEARIARMDSDTMSKRGSHGEILQKFKDHEIDIIVGTQMIAKGLDFPKVTQVGVIAADANLNLPDFRAGERTFNLITQVAGRAGRGDLGGEVFVQTFIPEHYAISFAAKHDYHGFYKSEIEARRDLGFPPFVNLIKITTRSRKEENAMKDVERLAVLLREKPESGEIVGPAPSPMTKIRGYFRWNVLVKTKDVLASVGCLRRVLGAFRKTGGVFVAVDVDPMSLN